MGVERATATDFGHLVRLMASEARRGGLTVPGFRTRPALDGASRTIRRSPAGAIVAVTLRGRTRVDLAGDLAEGFVVANRLVGAEAEGWRARLLAAVGRVDRAA